MSVRKSLDRVVTKRKGHFMFLIPYYIKKEDASRFLESQRVMLKLVAVTTIAVMMVMQFKILPQVKQLYIDSEVISPWFLAHSSLLFTLFYFLIFWILIFSEKAVLDKKIIDKKLSKYKSGEMISFQDLTIKSLQRLSFAIIVMVGTLLFSVIYPISNLTSQLSY